MSFETFTSVYGNKNRLKKPQKFSVTVLVQTLPRSMHDCGSESGVHVVLEDISFKIFLC